MVRKPSYIHERERIWLVRKARFKYGYLAEQTRIEKILEKITTSTQQNCLSIFLFELRMILFNLSNPWF